ncbi:hypothetical protein NQ314_002454 [Rhamnusium bicolor]|uniref:DDE Tnp4 domain-containing protein n=1 Tax=Rhamnusium bicolor TaxID=1586634 RepID=A0AAV8ZQ65_9CUCU|nr:hypothetical protein NQ314_002454 [Rhamnusium bicolor]
MNDSDSDFSDSTSSEDDLDMIVQLGNIITRNDKFLDYFPSLSIFKVLIFLWFMGHQTASFHDVSDRFCICAASLHRIISRVSVFLSNLSPQLITWPNEREKREIEEHFKEKGFPNVIGAIDESHIETDIPQNDPDSYINRKGYYSVQVSMITQNIEVDIALPIHDDGGEEFPDDRDARRIRNQVVDNLPI